MVESRVTLFYACPSKTGGELARKAFVVRAHVSRRRAGIMATVLSAGLRDPFVRMGEARTERVPSHGKGGNIRAEFVGLKSVL